MQREREVEHITELAHLTQMTLGKEYTFFQVGFPAHGAHETDHKQSQQKWERKKQKTWRLYKNPKFVETPRKHHAKSESNKKEEEKGRKGKC
jgi:hypothetical protein